MAVGQQHEFLDEFVGILGHLEIGAHRVSLFVHIEAYLRPVERNGSVRLAPGAQGLGQAVEQDEFLGIFPYGRTVGIGLYALRVVAGLQQVLG